MSKAILCCQSTEREPVLDHCGVVGAFSSQDISFFDTGLLGLKRLQTRGYDGAGFFALNSRGEFYQYKNRGMVKEVFSPKITGKFRAVSASVWIYQTRYGTSGGFERGNLQPLIANHQASGEVFCVAHNGQFVENGFVNGRASDTVRFVNQLARSGGAGWDERIMETLWQKEGAWSLIIGTKTAMYLARDDRGVRPLYYGRRLNGSARSFFWLAASETKALTDMGIDRCYEVMPGSLIKIEGQTPKPLMKSVYSQGSAVCIFEDVYISDGGSKVFLPRENPEEVDNYFTINEVRYRCGQILAGEAPLGQDEADLVVGVPGTGIPGGKGFAQASGLAYRQAIKDRQAPEQEQRTFMQAEIDSILQKVMDHFVFDEEELRGRRLVLVDDSIVRGNVMTGLVRLLKEKYGARAVHVRILCPPIDKGCFLGINIRSDKELIAHRLQGEVEAIRAEIGADTLNYLSSSGLRTAVAGCPEANGFCQGCMLGHDYPIRRQRQKLS